MMTKPINITIMEKLIIIFLELCAIMMSIQMGYHYLFTNDDSILLIFAMLFAFGAVLCHSIQRKLTFNS